MENTALVHRMVQGRSPDAGLSRNAEGHRFQPPRIAWLSLAWRRSDSLSLLQDRLKTVVWLDGGYFLWPPEVGNDQADFVPQDEEAVLMVNGRYDYVFPLDASQTPMFGMLGRPRRTEPRRAGHSA